MTYQTSPGQTGHAGAVAASMCHRLFSIEQAADLAGVPVRVICRWIRMGKLEAYHLGGGRVRIDEVELADLISSRGFRAIITSRQDGRIEPRFASVETSRRRTCRSRS